MTKTIGIYCMILVLLGMIKPKESNGQDINIRIGFRDNIQSGILHENRNIMIHLPDNYTNSTKSYPVLYRLDGDTDLLLETVSVVNRLSLVEETLPEMIVIAIENTNRSRDMWPVNTKYYPKTEIAGAKDFLDFIEKELIPYIEKNYKTTQNRILCGQSLSGVFTLYAFLSKKKTI